MKPLVAFLALGVLACAPPRDAAWFEAHPQEARAVLAGCGEDSHDAGCVAARAGLRRATAEARASRYRQDFE